MSHLFRVFEQLSGPWSYQKETEMGSTFHLPETGRQAETWEDEGDSGPRLQRTVSLEDVMRLSGLWVKAQPCLETCGWILLQEHSPMYFLVIPGRDVPNGGCAVGSLPSPTTCPLTCVSGWILQTSAYSRL